MVYDWKEKEERLEKLKNKGADVVLIPNYGRKKENLYQRLRFEWITRVQQRRFINNFQTSGFDYTVINQGGFMEVCSHPWKNFYKRLNNYTLTFHNYSETYSFNKTKGDLLKNWINNASNNLYDSGRGKTVLETQLGNFKINNYNLLFNSLNVSIRDKALPFERFEGIYKMVMLSALDVSRKAQDNLIKTFSSEKWKARNWSLEIYGEGCDKEMLEKLIIDLGLSKKISIMRATSNVEKVLSSSHILLQITHIDAMPLAVVEAMCMGRPVVVSEIGDMPDWVAEGKNGFVAKKASIEQMDIALENAWESKDKWEQMGVNAFGLFKAKFPHRPKNTFITRLFKTNQINKARIH
jgi:glycosyltransferase involved in cell wall biosynthesis